MPHDSSSSLPPLTVGRFFTVWHFDPVIAAVSAVLVVGYLIGLRRVRSAGPWPLWRAWSFVVLGAGSIVIATMSSLGVYEHVLLWPAAVQLTLLLTVTPLCLGLGDPIGLAVKALPGSMGGHLDDLVHSPVVRLLTFPAVGAILATITQFAIFFTGYLGAAMQSATLLHVLQLQVTLTGCLFALPLLGVELLPAWCNQPMRMAFAGLDGLLDAIPGIAVISASGPIVRYYVAVRPPWSGSIIHDQWVAGGLMITLAEVIAIPFVAALFRAWIFEDARAAARVDREIDEAHRVNALRPAQEQAPDPSKPWWEVDPGPLADRARRYGWDRPKSDD